MEVSRVESSAAKKPTAISMQLIRKEHASAIRRSVAVAAGEEENEDAAEPGSSSSSSAEAEAAAVLQLKCLRLEGLDIAEIDNLEPFDEARELYLGLQRHPAHREP